MKLGVSILAGGKSSRMGSNKALLKLNNETFLKRLLKEFSDFEHITVSRAAGSDYEDLENKSLDSKCLDSNVLEGGVLDLKSKSLSSKVCLVTDEHKEIGPIEGIYQSIKNTDCDYVFVCAVDMPFVTKELVQYMEEFISSDYDCYCIKDDNRVHPLCAIYSKEILPIVEALIEEGNYKLLELLNRSRTKYISLEFSCFDKRVVKNINTKEEYAKLSTPIVFAVSGTKNSGKTFLIVKLINEFINQGRRVGVIKHDGHDFQMDCVGTDTDRFMRAGSAFTAIYSEHKFSINAKKSTTPDELTHLCRQVDKECEVIILEGQKNSLLPKVWVAREESFEPYELPENVLCVVTDSEKLKAYFSEKCTAPIFDFESIDNIYSAIRDYFGI